MESGVSREAVYRALSGEGDPRLSTLTSVLSALGFGLEAKVLDDHAGLSLPWGSSRIGGTGGQFVSFARSPATLPVPNGTVAGMDLSWALQDGAGNRPRQIHAARKCDRLSARGVRTSLAADRGMRMSLSLISAIIR